MNSSDQYVGSITNSIAFRISDEKKKRPKNTKRSFNFAMFFSSFRYLSIVRREKCRVENIYKLFVA